MESYKKIAIVVLITIGITIFAVISFNPIIPSTININNTTEGGIAGAIANASSGDVIILSPGNYTGTNNTGINISKNIVLKGNGSADTVIIDGENLTRIFSIGSDLNVKFINITFANANSEGNGGAISNPSINTKVNFTNCTFINNKVTNTTSSDGFGGSIYNNGVIGLVNCIFTNVDADNSGGAIYSSGVGVGLVDCVFTNVTAAGSGGAIYSSGVGVGLVDCVFTNVTAVGSGAIYSDGVGMGLVNCVFTNISAEGTGGAIYTNGIGKGLVDCVFTNISAGGNGDPIAGSADVAKVDCEFINITTI